MKSLRDYINLVEGEQLDEAGPYTAGQPAPAPTGNSFDAKLAQAQAAQQAKGGRTGPVAKTVPTPDPKGPGARPTGWMARMRGDDARWDTANAAKYNPDGTAKKPAVAVAKAKPAAPATPAAPAQQAAQPAPTSAPAADQSKWEVKDGPASPWPAGSPQEAAWMKLSDEDKAWIGQADPTDQFILARAPNGGKPAAAPAQGAMPAKVAGQAEIGADGKVTAASVANPDNWGSEPSAPGTTPAPQQAAEPATPDINDIVKSKLGENTAYQNDELTRLVSLVRHR